MKSVLKSFFLIFILIYVSPVKAQMQSGVAMDAPTIQYKNESYGGINIHALGFGLSYKRAKHVTALLKKSWDFDLVTFHHSKQIKTKNQYSENSKAYYFGKLNSVLMLRAGYGFQKVLFGKELPGAIEIRMNYYVGASIGILKPVYLEIIKDSNAGQYLESEKYDPEKHQQSVIDGRSSWFRGLSQLTINPGVYGKFGFSFEFGTDEERVKVIETGVVADFHPSAMKMMAFDKNNPLIVSFYVSLLWGKRWY
jgi:hypothetical protein